MSADYKTTIVLMALAAAFLALTEAFRLNLWGRVEPPAEVAIVDPFFTNTMTVRTNAAALIRMDGDTSGQDCYACHDKAKPPQVKMNEKNEVVLPEEHNDLVIQHGRNRRNDHCYNCHDSANLDHLLTRDGHRFKLVESTMLCASCHGPTYRDWEVGIHGRVSGYWDRQKGPVTKQDCTACHDPHSPAFTTLKPAPGPHPLHPSPARVQAKGEAVHE
ncbi:MAG: hypothetical protein HY735_08410 [Verrucomicrobia bacterium]|nr:hypothetical protein [Verrucomicrobiota bacterium]